MLNVCACFCTEIYIQAYAIKPTATCTRERDVHIEKIINMFRDLYDIYSDSVGYVICIEKLVYYAEKEKKRFYDV